MVTADAGSSLFRNAIVTYLVTLGTTFVASVVGESWLWGFNWYQYFNWGAWLGLVAAVLIVPVVMRGAASDRDRSVPRQAPARSPFPVYGFLTIVVSSAAFYIFPCETHFLGDGMLLLNRLETGALPSQYWNPGAYFVQDHIYSLFDVGGQETARLTFRIISWSSGLLFSLALLGASTRLFGGWRERLLFTLGVLFGGYALLFFGYVENYPVLILCVGLFGLSGLLVTQGKLGCGWPIPPMVLGGLFHPFAVIMLPGCVYLLCRKTALAERLRSASRIWRIGAIGAAVAILAIAGIYSYSYFKFLRFALVPWVENRFTIEGYTLLSLHHLVDWFNLLFVLAPSLPLLTVLFLSRAAGESKRRPGVLFLILMLLPSLAISFLFDPKLGMPRDWDLFGFVGLPLAILFYYILLDRDGPRGGPRVAVFGLVLSLLVLGPRVATQTIPAKSVELFDTYAAQDKFRSNGGRFVLRQYLIKNGRVEEAERRRKADNLVLPGERWDLEGRACFQRGQLDSAMRIFRYAIGIDPSFYLSYANLGVVYASMGQNDSALTYLEIADGLMPSNPVTCNNLGGVLYSLGNHDEAEEKWLEAAHRSSENYVAIKYLAQMYREQNRFREHDSLLNEIGDLDRIPLSLLLIVANRHVERSEYDAATRAFRMCLVKGLDTTIVCAIQDSLPKLEVIDCED